MMLLITLLTSHKGYTGKTLSLGIDTIAWIKDFNTEERPMGPHYMYYASLIASNFG